MYLAFMCTYIHTYINIHIITRHHLQRVWYYMMIAVCYSAAVWSIAQTHHTIVAWSLYLAMSKKQYIHTLFAHRSSWRYWRLAPDSILHPEHSRSTRCYGDQAMCITDTTLEDPSQLAYLYTTQHIYLYTTQHTKCNISIHNTTVAKPT